jgi:hypothetical protein
VSRGTASPIVPPASLGKISHADPAHYVAQPRGQVCSGGTRRVLYLGMECRVNVQEEMANWAFGITLVDLLLPSAVKAPVHDVAHHGGTRLVAQPGQLIHLGPRHLLQAGVGADAVTRPMRCGILIGRLPVHARQCVWMLAN